MSYDVINHGNWTPIICTYLSPSTLEHLSDLKEDLTLFQDQDPIVIGYLSADISKPQNPHSQQVADLMTDFGLMNLLHHFWQCWRYLHVKTWPQERHGRAMGESSNNIMGTDQSRF